MELRHLRYFAAVAELENVSRAALKLHVSQPGLSRQVRDLEGELGVRLFERSAKSLRLTEAGKVFLREAQAILARVELGVAAARGAAKVGELHVGYAPSLTIEILPRALRAMQRDFPKARVLLHDFSTEEMLTQLRAGTLGVALMAPPAKGMWRGLEFRELAKYPMWAAVAPNHRLAKLKDVTLAQLAEEPMIAFDRKNYPEFHARVASLFGKLKARIVEEHEGINGVVAAVEAGAGFALVVSCLTCMVGTRLKLLPVTDSDWVVTVGAAWRTDDKSALPAAFVAAAAAV